MSGSGQVILKQYCIIIFVKELHFFVYDSRTHHLDKILNSFPMLGQSVARDHMVTALLDYMNVWV